MKIKSTYSDRLSFLLCFSKFYSIWDIDQNLSYLLPYRY